MTAPSGAGEVGAGSRLRNRYELGEKLAEGFFFISWRAQDTTTGRPVLLKILKPEHDRDENLKRSLITESRAAARLADANISQIYEAWREGEMVCIATELIRGSSLRERISRVAPFPLQVAVEIAYAIALALDHASKEGFVHADLRPENAIITPEGRVKVTDFGVGSSVPASPRINLPSLPPAAPYVAPEVITGHTPDARADIYALGCILFEMLTGHTPYTAPTPVAMAAAHLHSSVPSPAAEIARIPPAVDGIVRKCLQKEPLNRYDSPRELLYDLGRVREGLRDGESLDWSPLPPEGNEVVPSRSSRSRRGRSVEPSRDEEDWGGAPSLKAIGGGFALLLVLAFVSVLAVTRFIATPPEVVVPSNLLRQSESSATAQIEALGLKAEVIRDYSSKVPAGQVIRVIPPSGTEIRGGKTVKVFVSRGSEPVVVPDLVGKSRQEALNAIRAAGFVVGEVTENYSPTLSAGEVMAQVPLAGGRSGRGSPVRLVVSKGPEPDQAPAPEPPADEETGLETSIEPAPDAPPSPGDLESRSHVVTVDIPSGSTGQQYVQIVVQHADGREETVHDQAHEPGATVEQTVTTFGRKGTSEIRVYINGRLHQRFEV